MKRVLALLLCLVLCLSLIPAAAAEGIEIIDPADTEDELITIIDPEAAAEELTEPETVQEPRDLTSGQVAINSQNFPDEFFRTLVKDEFDTDKDSVLSSEELLNATELNFDSCQIASLKGIEHLRYLVELCCVNDFTLGSLTEVDLSGNKALEVVNLCFNPSLTALDVTMLPKLRELNVGFSHISELDLSRNPALRSLWINDAAFSSINLSHNPLLETLDVCGNPDLSVLDIHACPSLVADYRDGGRHLEWMKEISQEMYDSIIVYGGEGDGGMDDHDYHLAVNTGMTILDAIPINGQYFPDPVFRAIVSDRFDGNADGKLDREEIDGATELICNEMGIGSLAGIEYLTQLKKLDCSANELETLDLSNNTELTFLDAGFNELTSLDLTNNTYLSALYCANNHLAELDVSMLPGLMKLYCYGNDLTELDVSNNEYLTDLCLSETGISAINLSMNEELELLDVGYCPNMTALDLSHNRALWKLVCDHSGITALELGFCPGLSNAYLLGEKTTENECDHYKLETADDCFVLSVDPETGIHAEQRCGDNAFWSFDDGVLTITGTGEIWDVIYGQPGYAIYAGQIKSLLIGEGITSVGGFAFFNKYTHMSSVSFPSTLTTIGNASFRLAGLTEVNFPAALETVVGWAFEDCGSLTVIRFTGPAPDLNFCCFNGVIATAYYPAADSSWTDAKIQDYYENHHICGEEDTLTWVKDNRCGDNAFWSFANGTLTITGTGEIWDVIDDLPGYSVYADQIEKLVIGEGITGVGSWAFYESYTKLKSVSLPSTLTEIGNSSFAGSGLTEITFPASLTKVVGWAFSGCTNLKTVTFTGPAPELNFSCFEDVTATVYYPGNDGSWTDAIIQDYYDTHNIGGNLTWVAMTKPTITTQPKSVSTTVGGTAKFTVKASGGGLSYQWQYRTSSTGSWYNSTASTARSATFTVTAESYRNGYQYRCKVTNAAGSVTSSAATLTVTSISKPAITSHPKTTTVAEGETAKFTVKATGGNLTYQWYYRISAGGTWTKCSGTGYNTATLSVKAVSYREGYQYRCLVTNSAGSIYTNNAALHILAKPAITTHPKTTTVAEGETVNFTVKATGGNLSYQWYYRVSSSGTWTKCSGTGYNTATLSVKAVAYREGYQYRCLVKNSLGSIYTNNAALHILAKPAITTQPTSKTATVGETVKFTVKATGGNLSYQWYYRVSSTGTWTKCTGTGYNTATLTVEAKAYRNGYQYRCLVKNTMGEIYTNAVTLTVK